MAASEPTGTLAGPSGWRAHGAGPGRSPEGAVAPQAVERPLLDAPSAALWRRVAARAVDTATVFFLLWVLVVLQILWFMDDLSDRLDPEPWGRAFPATVAFVVLSAAYEVVFLRGNDGQTPGKDLLNVRVVRRADDGNPSVARAARRWLLPGLAALVWPIWAAVIAVFATGLTVPFGAARRTLHDHLAGTMVVHFERDTEDDDAGELDEGNTDASDASIVLGLFFGHRQRRARRHPRPGSSRSPRQPSRP